MTFNSSSLLMLALGVAVGYFVAKAKFQASASI
jgi:hypothetical protein